MKSDSIKHYVMKNKLLVGALVVATCMYAFGGSEETIEKNNIKEKEVKKVKTFFSSDERNHNSARMNELDKIVKELQKKNLEMSNELSKLKSEKDKKEAGADSYDMDFKNITNELSGYMDEVSYKDASVQKKKKIKTVKKIKKYKKRWPVLKEKTLDVKVSIKNVGQITLPHGSRIYATLLNGAEPANGKNAPVLLQFDHVMHMANNYIIDLSGCLALGRAQGNISNERADILIEKMACISPNGDILEKENLSGWVADGRDNSNGIIGNVNTKGHKAAFKSAFAEMIGMAGQIISKTSTVTSDSPLGSVTKTIVNSNSATAIAGSAISKGAQSIASWFMKNANTMLPTINIGSGQKVWVILLKSVKVPKYFFKKEKINAEVSDSIIF